MRYFDTSDPCNPAEHYTVLRRKLVAEGMEKVRRGRYVTIFAPRQSGKTTFFKLLIGELWQAGEYKPVWVSFENLKNATREQFYEAFGQLNRELEKIADLIVSSASPFNIVDEIKIPRTCSLYR